MLNTFGLTVIAKLLALVALALPETVAIVLAVTSRLPEKYPRVSYAVEERLN